MLVGGIHEAEIDRRIVGILKNLQVDPADNRRTLSVSAADKTELLLSVVSGNLDLNIGCVERELKAVISFQGSRTARQKTRSLTSLLNMMASQYSFGSVVGAPVLFYIGAFVYAVIDLSGNLGDNDTARKLFSLQSSDIRNVRTLQERDGPTQSCEVCVYHTDHYARCSCFRNVVGCHRARLHCQWLSTSE